MYMSSLLEHVCVCGCKMILWQAEIVTNSWHFLFKVSECCNSIKSSIYLQVMKNNCAVSDIYRVVAKVKVCVLELEALCLHPYTLSSLQLLMSIKRGLSSLTPTGPTSNHTALFTVNNILCSIPWEEMAREIIPSFGIDSIPLSTIKALTLWEYR